MKMTIEELLEAVIAAGITPDELTLTLRGGAVSVRRTMLELKARSIRERGMAGLATAEAEAQAIDAEIAAITAAQVAAAGGK